MLLLTAFGLLTEVETAATHVHDERTLILGVRQHWLRQLHVQSLEGVAISGLVSAVLGRNQFHQIQIVFTSYIRLPCCNDHTFFVPLSARLCGRHRGTAHK